MQLSICQSSTDQKATAFYGGPTVQSQFTPWNARINDEQRIGYIFLPTNVRKSISCKTSNFRVSFGNNSGSHVYVKITCPNLCKEYVQVTNIL